MSQNKERIEFKCLRK